jgi:ureidoacrylate peracid hydrolase
MTPVETALLLVDLQNDFVHPRGAYGRAGQNSDDIAALPERLAPLARRVRQRGGMVVATLFTLPPGRGGEPIISPHLKQLRPFLAKGDFEPGSWGQALIDELAPADVAVEKIAYSAFYMSRLEYVLRKSGIQKLLVGGIVTNGGVASTVRDAHVREFEITVLSDGCATFSRPLHEVSIEALRPVARITSVSEAIAEFEKDVSRQEG